MQRVLLGSDGIALGVLWEGKRGGDGAFVIGGVGVVFWGGGRCV